MDACFSFESTSDRRDAYEQSRARPLANPDRTVLAWLSLSETCESHAADSDIYREILVSEDDPNLHSPDPFLSNENWRQLVASHRH